MDNQNKLVIGEDSWEGFQGMFVYYNECGLIGYYYKINGSYYDAISLVKEDIDDKSYYSGCDLMDSFTMDTNGSEILIVNISGQGLLYQQLSNGVFVNILPTVEELEVIGELEENSYTLKVPLPNGKDVDGEFQELVLKPIDEIFIQKIDQYMDDEQREIADTEIVKIINTLYENNK